MHGKTLLNKFHNRREFLKSGISVLGGVAVTRRNQARPVRNALSGAGAESDYWQWVRAQF